MRLPLWVCLLSTVGLLAAQDSARFTTGDLAGFTKSPTEHIINRIDEPFIVREIRGDIKLSEGHQGPLPHVLFELRGPDPHKKIRQTTSNERGEFRLRRVVAGTYQFKATLNGFKSIVGTIVVADSAPKAGRVKLRMWVGV